MDENVEVKEEPVSLEGPSYTSFDNYEGAAEIIHMKEETKSEYVEPELMQVDIFEPLADVKHEIFVEEHPVDQLNPCLDAEDNGSFWDHMLCEMDMEVAIKEEPVFLEETESTSLPFEGVKDEITIEEHTVDHVNPCFKEETSVENVAVLTGGPTHPCPNCCKKYKTRSSLKRHMLSHTGERPYFCNLCDRRFLRNCDVLRHMPTHSELRPYTCTVCNIRSSSRVLILRTIWLLILEKGNTPVHYALNLTPESIA
ncbi:zinc finger protein 343-like [Anabrus simplex]|uniref:zinc finger protein 343-like n=1 Tax=Anabrus simplex TaxID=316456 RepID=UPI0035A2D1C1